MPREQTASALPPVWQRFVFGRSLRRTVIRAAILAATCFVVFRFFLVPIRIHGISMEPAYHDGGFNLVNRLVYSRHGPARGDVVAVKTSGWHIMYLKRIVGLPGETIAIRQGIVLIDGNPLEEPYVKRRESWEMAPVKLDRDHHFVIGDNRGMDQRLHEFGTVRTDKILGKVLW